MPELRTAFTWTHHARRPMRRHQYHVQWIVFRQHRTQGALQYVIDQFLTNALH
ncbi:hypothetical protein HYV74_01090 [Candidatus Uhrbacteria bacterium]|nr:hypothetical protein [Candidatus Uhrbacteria bacterium]